MTEAYGRYFIDQDHNGRFCMIPEVYREQWLMYLEVPGARTPMFVEILDRPLRTYTFEKPDRRA